MTQLHDLLRIVQTELAAVNKKSEELQRDEQVLIRAIELAKDHPNVSHQSSLTLINKKNPKRKVTGKDAERAAKIVSVLREEPGKQAHLKVLVLKTGISKTTLKTWGKAYEREMGDACPWVHGDIWAIFRLRSSAQQ